MVLKVIVYFFIFIIIKVNAGLIVKRSHLGSTSLAMDEKFVSSNIPPSQSMHVTYNSYANDVDVDRNNMDPALYHRSYYHLVGGGEEQKSKNHHLKYGVTNIGSRQHRYGEGTWRPNPDQTEQEKSHNINNNNNNSNNNYSNNKSVPRRNEKSLTSMETQEHVLDLATSTSKENEIENHYYEGKRKKQQKDIIALDNHGQLHTLALPMTILPGN